MKRNKKTGRFEKKDKVTINRYHQRVREERGAPSKCEKCGTENPNKIYDWATTTGNYENMNDYIRLCRDCHKDYDSHHMPSSDRHHFTKLTAKDKMEILVSNLSDDYLSKQFNVSKRTVRRVRQWSMKGIAKRIDKGFETSSNITPEFREFGRAFRKAMRLEVESIDGVLLECHTHHFYCSGFFMYKNQLYYFSIEDVRSLFQVTPTMLIRTAKSLKDYTGGMNTYQEIKPGMLEEYFTRHGVMTENDR